MKQKLVIVSDSHNNVTVLQKIIDIELPFDFIIHCGDGVGDLLHVKIPNDINIVKVTGNVDLDRGYDIERNEIMEVNKFKILITHGDIYRVQDDFELILKEGASHNVDAVFFGHTHKKLLFKSSPVLFNPGPATKGSYGVAEINDSVKFYHKILQIKLSSVLK